MTVTTGGYHSSVVTARAGMPTVLLVRSVRAHGCVRELVIVGVGATRALPVDGETRIEHGSRPRGNLRYSCAIGMCTGRIDFRPGP